MHSATSFAFPNPKPTLPSLSPAMTNALKLKRRPPLTTFAHLFIATTFSSTNGSSESDPPIAAFSFAGAYVLLLMALSSPSFSGASSSAGASCDAGDTSAAGAS